MRQVVSGYSLLYDQVSFEHIRKTFFFFSSNSFVISIMVQCFMLSGQRGAGRARPEAHWHNGKSFPLGFNAYP